MPHAQRSDARDAFEFEYSELLSGYHKYFSLIAKGISIYLLIIGACLTLPYSLRSGTEADLVLLREMCRTFAIIVSVGGIAGFLIASYSFFCIHRRAKYLAAKLGMASPHTHNILVIVWLSCAVAVLLAFLIARYS